ncbi:MULTISPECIES: helix-turn-helix transcriptional regulator [Microbacterium]|jgi:DNA-binding CsgD family transcriptional regulator|uniref:helix-turn-helix transcriptional regulator n=1 Tax=Microbacterium TaxID=33882 RepID=UPI0023DB42A6|nr:MULTISPECIES: helix-turn-helix transcriptional regulator [Microbacterium]MDF2047838.1 helix-turn-helix transcriptional regulator [Microbacterium sp. Kw_RZR3]MDF2919389.1 DNA-binding protein [Microbacterium sp.]MDQ1074651.1 DNA-binding CsgD family transcriptional regulator [Microbacterium sp. SORGH_AS_0969]MDQ1114875.1 DNA-binding CsgD family transcriptional regulator [Microbacterium testaceum]
MSDPESSTDPGTALRAAAAHTVLRLEPGHGQPLARHLALLAEAEPGPPPLLWTDARAMMLSAVLVARARHDALGEGLDLVSRYFDTGRLTRPAALSGPVRSGLFASVAEYCAAAGWPQLGGHYAAEALLFAETPGQRYRALSAQALCLGLNAEYPAARRAIHEAWAIFGAERWGAADVSHCLLLGEVLVAVSRADVERMREIADELERAQPDNPYWAFSAGMVRVSTTLIDRGATAGLSQCRELLHGSGRSRSFRITREILLGVYADMLASLGEFEEALAVISHAVTHPGHAVCFPMQRAGVLLQMGRERELIDITNACVALHDEHCLRTLTPLLTRRAVAFLRLGNEKRAVQSMEAAVLLIQRTGGSLTPFLMIPLSDTDRLLDLVASHTPDLAPAVTATRQMLPRVAASSPSVDALSALTATERELAHLLTSSLSLAEIARVRSVSTNTVKSQVRSIYGKLGVSSREEAVGILRGSPT